MAAALFLTASCVPGELRRAAADTPETAAGAPETVIQLLYRSVADGSAFPDRVALQHLADRAALGLTGASLALDGWQAICGGDRMLVATTARSGPVVQAVERRLELLAGPGRVKVVVTDEAPPEACLWIVRADWQEGAILPRQFRCSGTADGSAGPVTLVDLLQPSVDGAPWTAGEIVAGTSPRAAAFVVMRILDGRAQGRLGDLGAQAAECGIDLERLEWSAEAVGE